MKMNNKRHQSFSINFGSFFGNVMCIVNKDWSEALAIEKKRLKKEKNIDWLWFCEEIEPIVSSSTAKGMALKRKNRMIHFALFIREFDITNPEDHIALAHECLHLCQYNLPDMLDRDMEHEAEAYTHSHLMRQFYEQINQ